MSSDDVKWEPSKEINPELIFVYEDKGEKPESQDKKWTSCDKCEYGQGSLCTNEIRNKTIISIDEYGNCKFYSVLAPTPERHEERIREAFEKEYSIPDVIRWNELHQCYEHKKHIVSQMSNQINSLHSAYKSGYQSRNAEVERLEGLHEYEKHRALDFMGEITAIKQQIKDMRSCLICESRKDKVGYKKWSVCIDCKDYSNFTTRKRG